MTIIKRYSCLMALWLVIGFTQFSSVVFAQTGDDALRFNQRFPGVTAANAGIGGVGFAGVRDGASLVLNPAGMGLVSSGMFSGSLAWGNAKNEAEYTVSDYSSTSEASKSEFTIGDLTYLYKAPTSRGSLVFGAAFHQLNSWERILVFKGENPVNSITDFFMPVAGEFEILEDSQGLYPDFSRSISFIAYETFAIDFDENLYDNGDPVPFLPAVRAGTVQQASRVEESGKMREFSFGAAYEASKGVFLGVSVNIPYGTYRFLRVFEEDDIYDHNNGQNGTTDFDYLTYVDEFSSEILGINARFGVIGYVTPAFRLGANVETPTSMSIEESYSTRLSTVFDNGDTFEYGGGIEDEGQGVFKYTLTSPWRIGVGAAYESPKFLAMFDVEWIDWSSMRYKSPSTNFSGVNAQISNQLTAVFSTKVGFEYRFSKLDIRAGFGYTPDPHGDRADTPANPTVDEERSYASFGLGYKFNRMFRADIGWIGEQYKEIYQPYTEVEGAPVVREEHTRGRVLVGVSVLF